MGADRMLREASDSQPAMRGIPHVGVTRAELYGYGFWEMAFREILVTLAPSQIGTRAGAMA
jgi:hypothetical protein